MDIFNYRNKDEIILKEVPKRDEFYCIKVPIEFIDYRYGYFHFKKFIKHTQNCLYVDIVRTHSDDIIKEKEDRLRDLKEDIQKYFEKDIEIPKALLEEYNNLVQI